MARDLHRIEKGLHLTGINSAVGVAVLFGSTQPGGDGDIQDAAEQGSLYIRNNGANSELYQKIGTANSTADWELNGAGTAVIGVWRSENVIAATNDSVVAGSVDVTGFSDNDDGLVGTDFSVGDYLISDADGTPALWEVTAVTSDTDITVAAASQALATNDTFVCANYLPDPSGQEGQAIINKTATVMVKLGDVNWEFATGINLSSGYSSGNGTISSADSVESAIEKLDGNQQDLVSLSGVAQGSTVLGAFSSPASIIMAATYTIKSALQRVGDLLAQLRGVQATGITTEATVDSVAVASVKACKWLIEAFEEATSTNRKAMEVYALNDGSTNVDDTVYAKLRVGSNFDLSISVDIDSGNMRLRAASTTAGVTVNARRIEVVKNTI